MRPVPTPPTLASTTAAAASGSSGGSFRFVVASFDLDVSSVEIVAVERQGLNEAGVGGEADEGDAAVLLVDAWGERE